MHFQLLTFIFAEDISEKNIEENDSFFFSQEF